MGTADAHPQEVFRVAGPSIWPLVAACGLVVIFIAELVKLRWVIGVGALVLVAAVIQWNRPETPPMTVEEEDAFERQHHVAVNAGGSVVVATWAMSLLILFMGIAFSSLLLSYFYLRLENPEWPPPGIADPGLAWAIAAAALVVLSGRGAYAALQRVRAGDQPGFIAGPRRHPWPGRRGRRHPVPRCRPVRVRRHPPRLRVDLLHPRRLRLRCRRRRLAHAGHGVVLRRAGPVRPPSSRHRRQHRPVLDGDGGGVGDRLRHALHRPPSRMTDATAPGGSPAHDGAMTAEDGTPMAVDVSRDRLTRVGWVVLLGAPVIWFSHFMVVYLVAEAGCAGGGPGLRAFNPPVPSAATLAATAVAAAGCLAFAAWGHRRWVGARHGTAPDDPGGLSGRHEERDRGGTMAFAGVLLSLFSFVAVVFVGFPAVVLEC